MAVTLDQIRDALTESGLKFHQADDTNILLGMNGDKVDLKLVISLNERGEYISVRTLHLDTCLATHPRHAEALGALAKANLDYRLIKFGWDPSDGEITAMTCLPLEDNDQLPATQLLGLVLLLSQGCDEVCPNLQRILKARGPSPAPSGGGGPTSGAGAGVGKGGGLQLQGLGIFLLGVAAIVATLYFIFVHKP